MKKKNAKRLKRLKEIEEDKLLHYWACATFWRQIFSFPAIFLALNLLFAPNILAPDLIWRRLVLRRVLECVESTVDILLVFFRRNHLWLIKIIFIFLKNQWCFAPTLTCTFSERESTTCRLFLSCKYHKVKVKMCLYKKVRSCLTNNVDKSNWKLFQNITIFCH
jgi:hypothetical protein